MRVFILFIFFALTMGNSVNRKSKWYKPGSFDEEIAKRKTEYMQHLKEASRYQIEEALKVTTLGDYKESDVSVPHSKANYNHKKDGFSRKDSIGKTRFHAEKLLERELDHVAGNF